MSTGVTSTGTVNSLTSIFKIPGHLHSFTIELCKICLSGSRIKKYVFIYRWLSIHFSLSSTLEHKRANQSIASACSDRGLTATQLCSTETHAIFSDFLNFQAGSVHFESVVVKH